MANLHVGNVGCFLENAAIDLATRAGTRLCTKECYKKQATFHIVLPTEHKFYDVPLPRGSSSSIGI